MPRSLVASAAFFAAILFPVAAMATNIGNVDEYIGSMDCHRAELVVPNGRGLVASMRHITCAVWGAPPVRQYFVFVHGPNEPDSEKNLVLSFERFQNDERPALIWKSKLQLWIGSGNQGDVHYFRRKVDATNVAYHLGSEIGR